MRASIGVALLVLLVGARNPLAAPAAGAPMTADQLIARVLSMRNQVSFRARVTVTRTIVGSNAPVVRQLLLAGRRDRLRAMMRYQQVWPDAAGGRAVVIQDLGDHRFRGFEYAAGRATPLTDDMRGGRFFDSDLRLEDLTENFWFWKTRSVTGEEAVGEYPTTTVEARPPVDVPTKYSRLKLWVSPDLGVALRVEQYGRDQRLDKQIGFFRVMKVGERMLPTLMTVEPADRKSRTVLEGTKYEPDPGLADADFTVAALKKLFSGP